MGQCVDFPQRQEISISYVTWQNSSGLSSSVPSLTEISGVCFLFSVFKITAIICMFAEKNPQTVGAAGYPLKVTHIAEVGNF